MPKLRYTYSSKVYEMNWLTSGALGLEVFSSGTTQSDIFPPGDDVSTSNGVSCEELSTSVA